MANPQIDTDAVVSLLNNILEAELAGVVSYTHYSLMFFGSPKIVSIKSINSDSSSIHIR